MNFILKRFIASVIDKICILQSFYLIYCIFNSIMEYLQNDLLGGSIYASQEIFQIIYSLDIQPHIYEYFDFPMLEIDKRVIYSFIIYNVLYYLISECIFKASLGKKIVKLTLVDAAENNIGYPKILARNIIMGLLMYIFVMGRFVFDSTYISIILWFFVVLDVPVLFCKRNLIDICTKTYFIEQKKIQITKLSGNVYGHDYVDLGLSVKWATCNVGAEHISDSGDYFAWGEIETKNNYTRENHKIFIEDDVYDISDNKNSDAARAKWRGTWRMPTKNELEELINGCKWEDYTNRPKNKGYKIIGPNGNSIFLPAAGWRNGTLLEEYGEIGYYLSSTPVDNSLSDAFFLATNDGIHNTQSSYCGFSVRPVSC